MVAGDVAQWAPYVLNSASAHNPCTDAESVSNVLGCTAPDRTSARPASVSRRNTNRASPNISPPDKQVAVLENWARLAARG